MVAQSPAEVSDRKLVANRRNAQKSTGPCSGAGKSRSARNAVKHAAFGKHVIFKDEDGVRYALIRWQFIQRLRPQDPLELALVERVAEGHWRLLRLNRQEAEEADRRCGPTQFTGHLDEVKEHLYMIQDVNEGKLPHSVMREAARFLRSEIRERRVDEIDRYGPARQRVEQSMSRAMRELRILQAPNKPTDLPESPYLCEVDDGDEVVNAEPTSAEENPRNEPTASNPNASTDQGDTCNEVPADPELQGPEPAAPPLVESQGDSLAEGERPHPNPLPEGEGQARSDKDYRGDGCGHFCGRRSGGCAALRRGVAQRSGAKPPDPRSATKWSEASGSA